MNFGKILRNTGATRFPVYMLIFMHLRNVYLFKKAGREAARVGGGGEQSGRVDDGGGTGTGKQRSSISPWTISVNEQFEGHGALCVNARAAVAFLDTNQEVKEMQSEYEGRGDPTRGPGGPTARLLHRTELRKKLVAHFWGGKGDGGAGGK